MKEVEIIFMPYISLEKPHQIGNVIFWPYHQEKKKYLGNIDNAISRLDKIANCYRNSYNNAPLKNIVVVSLKNNQEFRPLTKQDREEIVDVINLFAYLWIHKIKSIPLPFFDNFIFNFYKINLEKDTGGMNLISRRGFNFNDINHIKFQTPHHIIIEQLDNNFPNDLAQTLSELIFVANGAESDQQEEAKRIIRAISWFNQSKYTEPLISDQAMFISLGVALETLLGIDQFSRKGEELSHSIQLLLGESEEIKNWTQSFYKRRSEILHGKKVETLDYGEHSSHITLAQIVFDHCLKTKLYLMKLWPVGIQLSHILWHSLDYYLVDNRRRVEEMLKYKIKELQAQEKAMSFIKLSWGLNTDTDLSGDKEFYKNAIIGIAKIIFEGLEKIDDHKEKYQSKIEEFEKDFQGIKLIIKKIINGEIDLANQLQPADVFVGKMDIHEYKPRAKHIQIGYGLLITDFYYLLNQLYELYEDRKHRLK